MCTADPFLDGNRSKAAYSARWGSAGIMFRASTVASTRGIGEDRHVSRVIACLALAVAVAAMVVAAVGGSDHAAAAPALLAGVFPAALVGLFVSLRRPGNVVA